METTKTYAGNDAEVAKAFLDLEIMIGDVDAEGHDTDDAVRAVNILIERLSGPTGIEPRRGKLSALKSWLCK